MEISFPRRQPSDGLPVEFETESIRRAIQPQAMQTAVQDALYGIAPQRKVELLLTGGGFLKNKDGHKAAVGRGCDMVLKRCEDTAMIDCLIDASLQTGSPHGSAAHTALQKNSSTAATMAILARAIREGSSSRETGDDALNRCKELLTSRPLMALPPKLFQQWVAETLALPPERRAIEAKQVPAATIVAVALSMQPIDSIGPNVAEWLQAIAGAPVLLRETAYSSNFGGRHTLADVYKLTAVTPGHGGKPVLSPRDSEYREILADVNHILASLWPFRRVKEVDVLVARLYREDRPVKGMLTLEEFRRDSSPTQYLRKETPATAEAPTLRDSALPVAVETPAPKKRSILNLWGLLDSN